MRSASFYRIAIAGSLCGRAKPPYARLSSASAGDLDRSPRCDRQLSKPIDDLSILCWDLKAQPNHHLPWAGFGLRQPHWLIQKCDVEKSRIHSDLEKKVPLSSFNIVHELRAVLCAVALAGSSRNAQSRGRYRSLQGLRGGDVIMPASISTHASLRAFDF